MTRSVSCGEALISLLESYEVDTVFGIPGVHTLDLSLIHISEPTRPY